MIHRFSVASLAIALSFAAHAKDVYLSIGGSVGVFRTDARIFNPSSTKDITIQAYYLPVGNTSNASVQPVTVTIAARQMKVYDDVVASIFNRSGLGAIRLTSSDDFIATQRIYAQVNGTLGQFVPGLDPTIAAKTKGVLIQLKSSNAFRTNIGAVNPNNTTASVTWKLHDKNNTLVSTGAPITLPPFAVIGPTSVASTFFFNPGAADLSDAWVSYSSDQPILAYASVVDNTSTDPTFIPASEDTDSPATVAKWYLSPILNFALSSTPSTVGSRKQLCFSPMTWETTLQGDLTGTTYKFSLGLGRCPPGTGGCTSFTALGDGTFVAEVVLKRGTAETILATTSLTSAQTYEVKTATVSGLDPDAQAGDTLMLRLRATAGQPCIAEGDGTGTDNYIETPGAP